ncbi:unnamed protein product, partial [Rotaria magnacalcarata]
SYPPQVHDIFYTNKPNTPESPDFSVSTLLEDQQQQLSDLIRLFPNVFSTNSGRTNKIQHHIDIQPGNKPRESAPYRYSPARRQIIESNLNEMLQEGGPVIVGSDCKALECLENARDPTDRLARWAIKLSPYNIVIQHRPDTSNPNGDFIFRYPLQTYTTTAQELNSLESGINILEGTSLLDNIRSAQQKDARLLRIIQSLSSQHPVPFNTKHSPYIVINTLL